MLLNLDEASELFKALSAPHRLRIVMMLMEGPRTVTQIVQELGISQPLASQHLRVLLTSRLLAKDRQGKEAHYRVADHHISHLINDVVTHLTECRTETSNDDD